MFTRQIASCVTAACLLVPAADAAVTLGTEVFVRVYDTTGARVESRQASLDHAAAIVAAASVEITWRRCDSGSADAPCGRPLDEGELTLRLVHAGGPAGARRELPLGNALVDAAHGAAVLATVYVDRVAWMSAQTGADPQRLLGRAIAHEIGHLLQASAAHRSSGLMRAVWSRPELQRDRDRDWMFGPDDVAAIRAKAAARATSSRPPLPRLARR